MTTEIIIDQIMNRMHYHDYFEISPTIIAYMNELSFSFRSSTSSFLTPESWVSQLLTEESCWHATQTTATGAVAMMHTDSLPCGAMAV